MKPQREPPITVLRHDLEKLEPLAGVARASPVRDYLALELGRAKIVESPSHAPNSVHLGAHVCFKDLTSGEVRTVSLVMPGEADINTARVSIFTPVGTALLGLSVGQAISYLLPSGRESALEVLNVTQPNR